MAQRNGIMWVCDLLGDDETYRDRVENASIIIENCEIESFRDIQEIVGTLLDATRLEWSQTELLGALALVDVLETGVLAEKNSTAIWLTPKIRTILSEGGRTDLSDPIEVYCYDVDAGDLEAELTRIDPIVPKEGDKYYFLLEE